jgi:phenylacetic acid degradation operon negative regulatory protein
MSGSVAPTPRRLVLDLLASADGVEAPVRELVRACAVFKLRETSVRVAIVRLNAEGLLESAGRGTYRLSEKAHALAGEVGTWRTVEKRVRPWSGAWLAARFDPSSRPARTLDRGLQMTGLKTLDRGFALRPDNLDGAADLLRHRLGVLGVEAMVFRARDFGTGTEARLRKLWDGKALTAGYQRSRERLEKWLERAHLLEPEVAARESFLLGGEAIRQIIFDPLLPAPLVDPVERKAFVDAMRTFDRVGRGYWLKLFGVELGAPDAVDGWVQ